MIDITRKITPHFPTWPGDTPFAFELAAEIQHGSTVNVGKFVTTTHLGTHLDAPFHYHDEGMRLDEIPLDLLVGECLVLDARGHRVLPANLLEGHATLPARVAFYTGEPAVWETFPTEFSHFSPALIEALASRGVRLLVTDAPSVDHLTSKDLPAHMACLQHDVLILEGVNLEGVQPGRYELICLPLHLAGADAAPARAILRPLQQ